jgi:hypothetical protein
MILLIGSSYGDESCGLATGNLTSADACGFGVGYVGLFGGWGDDATSVFGTITYGFSDYTEGRFKFGFSDLDVPRSDPQIMVGFDFKYELLDYYDKLRKNPCDLALGAFTEYVDYEGFSEFELGGNIIGSIPYRFESGYKLVPYSRINIRLERYSNHGSESDFRAGLNFGAKFELSSEFNMYGELQVDGNTGLFIGAEIRAF